MHYSYFDWFIVACICLGILLSDKYCRKMTTYWNGVSAGMVMGMVVCWIVKITEKICLR